MPIKGTTTPTWGHLETSSEFNCLHSQHSRLDNILALETVEMNAKGHITETKSDFSNSVAPTILYSVPYGVESL